MLGRHLEPALWVLIALDGGSLGLRSIFDAVRSLDGPIGHGTLVGALSRLERLRLVEFGLDRHPPADVSSDDTWPSRSGRGLYAEGTTGMSALVRLYPAAWRARYGAEFEALLADRPPSRRDLLDILLGAIDARLSPQGRSPEAARSARITDRLAGGAAIGGGLVWSSTYLVGWLVQAEGDLSLPILFAIGLMLLSLPGTYLVAYARPVVLGAAAFVISIGVLFAQVLPWGYVLLVPIVAILGTIGPGALTLAAARAGLPASARWRLLLLTIPWPMLSLLVTLAGFVPSVVPVPLVIASVLPLGIAWIVIGARIARGANRTISTIATAGGAA